MKTRVARNMMAVTVQYQSDPRTVMAMLAVAPLTVLPFTLIALFPAPILAV